MLKSIIVDDEKHCVDRLSFLLEKYSDIIEITAICSTVEDAKKSIEKILPDILFLDVHLYEETAFDLLKKLDTINFEIVFITAFDNYAIDAFKYAALDYLLKPIEEESFEKTIDKLKKKTSLKDIADKMDVLFYNLQNKNAAFNKIVVPTMEGLEFIKIDDIIRCQSDNTYTHIFLKGNKRKTVSKTLKHYENLLEQHHFFRIHHSHLVNISCIDKYIKGKGGYIITSDGAHIEVAVRRKEEFIKKLHF